MHLMKSPDTYLVLLPQVRALAAAVLSSMLEGPAQKAYIIIAEAKSAARPPVRHTSSLSRIKA